MKFLGHLMGGDGIQPDPDKVKAIREMAPPNNKKEARRFMGTVNREVGLRYHLGM